MEYEGFKGSIMVRIDPGEGIPASIRKIALKREIKLASISGLGVINNFTVGIFETAEKEYKTNEFSGYYEIVLLTGTINTMRDEFYYRLHMSTGGKDGNVVGGHLNRTVISATCELVIRVIDGRVDRSFNEKVGLNLFDLHR